MCTRKCYSLPSAATTSTLIFAVGWGLRVMPFGCQMRCTTVFPLKNQHRATESVLQLPCGRSLLELIFFALERAEEYAFDTDELFDQTRLSSISQTPPQCWQGLHAAFSRHILTLCACVSTLSLPLSSTSIIHSSKYMWSSTLTYPIQT